MESTPSHLAAIYARKESKIKNVQKRKSGDFPADYAKCTSSKEKKKLNNSSLSIHHSVTPAPCLQILLHPRRVEYTKLCQIKTPLCLKITVFRRLKYNLLNLPQKADYTNHYNAQPNNVWFLGEGKKKKKKVRRPHSFQHGNMSMKESKVQKL